MEFFKQNTKIEFMRIRKWTALVSLVLFTFSIIALVVNGLNFGLDFTGGLQIEASYAKPADTNLIRENLTKAGFTEAVVQSYGSSKDVLITIRKNKQAKQDQIVQKVVQAIPNAKIERVDFVGSQVGRELATKGALAMVISLIGTLIYIALRFEYRFAVSSTLALVHDPMLILGIFALFHIEFNLPALAAVLAVIGYSLNDTIVVFDRVRENFRKMRKSVPIDIMNISINQTLSRTIMTSALTLIAVLCLFFLGGDMIRSFSLAMIIGIVIGTYSSIYVAGALALAMGLNRKDFLPPTPKELDDRP
ncbi:MAG: protein translocase subunit SecF [Pseudomonadota bacterium]